MISAKLRPSRGSPEKPFDEPSGQFFTQGRKKIERERRALSFCAFAPLRLCVNVLKKHGAPARTSLAVLVWTLGSLAACNYTVGECYPRAGDDGSGDTGVLISSGAGGFGDTPPKEPQDESSPPPDCNIVPGTPCEEKCLADYGEEAAVCGKVEIEAQRRTCQEGAYEHYKSCRGACQQSDDCRRRCDEQAEACEAECRKLPIDDKVGRQKCWAACNDAYAKCIKKCK